jgi:hypothetical protein
MASTYSTSLGIELIGQGEQSGTWGITTNNNLGTLIEQAITGVQTITMSNATYTLTTYQGAADESRNAVLVLAGTNLAPQDLVAPAVEKIYLIKNTTGNTVNIKTTTGNSAAISNGTYAQVYCDGLNFYNATPSANYISGDLSVTGSGSFGNNVVVTNTITANTGSFSNLIASGIIKQIVYATGGGSFSGSSLAPTGFVGYITPKSASSKIIAMVSTPAIILGSVNTGAGFTLFRNSTNLAGGSNYFSTIENGYNDGNTQQTAAFTVVDQPGSTSNTAYSVYGLATALTVLNPGVYGLSGTSLCNMTLIEVA